MVTRAELNEYKRGQQTIDRLVRRDINQAWTALGAVDPTVKRDLLLDITPGLVSTYGPVAAALAAEFFTETTGLAATIPAAAAAEAVEASTRAVIGGLWTGDDLGARDRLADSLIRHTRRHGRATIRESVGTNRDRVRFARILSYASKKGPCSWCRMLASRGAVYHSEITAGGLDDWHDTCACDAVAVRSPEDFPSGVAGYDEIDVHPDTKAWIPVQLYDEYDQVHEFGDNDRDVASKMRATYGYT